MSASRPSHIHFKIGSGATTGTAKALLNWDSAPQTCAAIVAACPFTSLSQHGRNSGDEALLITPSVISHIPQDSTENATQTHAMHDVLFGFEPTGFCKGGAGDVDVSEIAWIYGEAAQAMYWVSEHGPPHDKPPFRQQVATLNKFARIVEEKLFYEMSKNLIKTGATEITVTCD